MAKLKKRSRNAQARQKHNPIGQKNIPATSNNQKILETIDKLKSTTTSVNEKLITINHILVQCNNSEEARKAYLKNDLGKVLLNDLLKNSSYDEILVSSLDLLSHILSEEPEFAIYLWRNSIWDILEKNFTNGFNSLSHMNDEKVNVISKDLLISYLEHLITILDNLIMELPSDIVESQLLVKLQESKLLESLFEIKVPKLVTLVLQFTYDFATISSAFLNTISHKTFELQGSTLAKAYIIGINLQIMEINKALTPTILNQITEEIFKNLESESTPSEEVVDISLDLLSTVIELESENPNKAFNELCNTKILPLVTNNLNGKKLLCLNNLLIYYQANNLVTNELIEGLLQLAPEVDFSDIDAVVDVINFRAHCATISGGAAENITFVNEIAKYTDSQLKFDEFTDGGAVSRLVIAVCAYFPQVKDTFQIENIKDITVLAVEKILLNAINSYKSELSKMNISKLHNKWGYLFETCVAAAVILIFELYDDDYPYNRELYHGSNGVGNVIENAFEDINKMYKNVDKNKNVQVKNEMREIVENLKRFIEYKKSE
ncbi:hypothetical protein CANINC_003890 [Pichia inconspicua]|uniref:Synchronized import protein 1 n=1 Tax=Pichia inconspicua TaxID=52247 RepID=A0A4T0WXH2_9ASCO|nr:hypothetical protein CANINC_003890 [[Candida] inconspicua]